VQFDKNNNPRLVFLDCGIVFAAKSEEEHKVLVDVCLAFLKHDGRGAARLMLARCTDLANNKRVGDPKGS
jgi:predicted unusual protein kinase regulating ubiquinone biosynthesis (AarF/ABC1/UbiB family)